MQNRSKEKKDTNVGFPLVFIGLIIGFFLGAGIVYWYSNQPDNKSITERALSYIARLFPESTPSADEDAQFFDTELQEKSKNQGKKPASTPPALLADSLSEAVISGEIDSMFFATHTPASEINDSIFIESLPYSDSGQTAYSDDSQRKPQTENIRVRRDKLVGVRSFSISIADRQQEQREPSRRLDSLIGKPPPVNRRIITVEFWESPLNFTGYKMGRNRIVLYGLDQIDLVGLYALQDTIYLKYYDMYFTLILTPEFKPLLPLTDPETIAKLDEQWL